MWPVPGPHARSGRDNTSSPHLRPRGHTPACRPLPSLTCSVSPEQTRLPCQRTGWGRDCPLSPGRTCGRAWVLWSAFTRDIRAPPSGGCAGLPMVVNSPVSSQNRKRPVVRPVSPARGPHPRSDQRRGTGLSAGHRSLWRRRWRPGSETCCEDTAVPVPVGPASSLAPSTGLRVPAKNNLLKAPHLSCCLEHRGGRALEPARRGTKARSKRLHFVTAAAPARPPGGRRTRRG